MKTPYDGRFKILAEEYPDLLLRLLGIVGPGMKTQPIDLVRELQLDPVQVDHVYRIGDEDSGRLVHFEAITSWRTQRIPLLALYHLLLLRKFKLPVSSYVVLMAEKYAPKTLPVRVVYEEPDGLRIDTPYEVIRLWEIDPSVAFEPGCEPLLPWVPLLKGGAAEFAQASAAIERLFDHPEQAPYAVDVMVSNLATLATLRYDKDAISHFLERLVTKIMLSTDLFTESWLYKDGEAAGRAAGRAEGEAKGEAKGKRASLLLALKHKFPAIAPPPEISQIDSSEELDQLLVAILEAHNADEARAAIQAAVRVN
jgi:predicted transposase YdaD